MRTKIALAFCAIGLMTGTSVAADLPVEVQYSQPVPMVRRAQWTGLYFGVNAGYSSVLARSFTVFEGNPNPPVPAPQDIALTSEAETRLKGGIAGGQIGFNWHTGWLLLGIEADGQWSGAKNTVTVACGVSCTLTETVKLRSFWTGRFRIGYVFDRILGYVTVGGAVADGSHDLIVTHPTIGTANFLTLSNSRAGVAAGAGIEAIVWENWSAKLEYLYLDIDNLVVHGFAPTALNTVPMTQTSRFRDHIVRVGANYRFGPTY